MSREKKQNWYVNPRKYHFIYKTTCSVNGKYYYGMHSTDDLEDGYIGSGTRLWHSIKKHGRENFKLEILEFCSNRDSLKQREAELITEEMLSDPMCMNLKLGGEGGWETVHKKLKSDPVFRKKHSEALSKSHQYRKGLLFNDKRGIWLNRKHSEATKEKISIANSVSQAGTKNSQFGFRLIHKDGQVIKIVDSQLEQYLNDGWIRGKGLISQKQVEKMHKHEEKQKEQFEMLQHVADLYQQHGTMKEVAKILECSIVTVHKRLKKYDSLGCKL